MSKYGLQLRWLHRFAQHEIPLLFCLRQFRGIQFAADHGPARIGQAFEQFAQQCRRAFKFDHLCALNFDQG